MVLPSPVTRSAHVNVVVRPRVVRLDAQDLDPDVAAGVIRHGCDRRKGRLPQSPENKEEGVGQVVPTRRDGDARQIRVWEVQQGRREGGGRGRPSFPIVERSQRVDITE